VNRIQRTTLMALSLFQPLPPPLFWFFHGGGYDVPKFYSTPMAFFFNIANFSLHMPARID
jgi:hypothetical protein